MSRYHGAPKSAWHQAIIPQTWPAGGVVSPHCVPRAEDSTVNRAALLLALALHFCAGLSLVGRGNQEDPPQGSKFSRVVQMACPAP